MAQGKERTLSIDIAREVQNAVDSTELPKPSKEGAGGDVTKPETAMEIVLNAALMRILTARNYAELGKTLENVSAKLGGDLTPEMLDQIKGQVVDTARQLSKDSDGRLTQLLKHHFDRHEYTEAAQLLKGSVDAAGDWLDTSSKDKLNMALGMVKVGMSDDERRALLEYVNTNINSEILSAGSMLRNQFEVLQSLLVKKEYDVSIKPFDSTILESEVKLKVKIKNSDKDAIKAETLAISDMDSKDRRLIIDLVGQQQILNAKDDRRGDREWDVSKMRPNELQYLWLRASGLLGKYETQLNTSPKLKTLLEEIRDATREVQLTKSEIGTSPESEKSSGYKKGGRGERSSRGLDFFQDYMRENEVVDLESLMELQYQEMLNHGIEDPRMEIGSRTESALAKLILEHPELRGKLVKRDGKWHWDGDGRKFLDLCRDQIYDIQGQLTGENMGNLIFEESAQSYLALMRVDVSNKPELQDVKDAITKMLYIDYAVKSMWQGGGNAEVWQRISRILTRERGKSFFEIMGMGEKLKLVDKNGQVIQGLDIGRFSADDIMSLADMKAEGVSERYWSTELASQSNARKEKKVKPKFAQAIAVRAIQNKVLMGDITVDQATEIIAKIRTGEYAVDDKQANWMMQYEQYLDNSTLRAGERGFNQSNDPNKFQLTDNPLGEFALKNGPWSVIYFYQYEVTKHGGDFIGEIFMPNTSMLSFARGETLAHFMKLNSGVDAGMIDAGGEYIETGVGVLDYVYGGDKTKKASAEKYVDFWGDVIFDTRTGTVGKTAMHRTVDQIRSIGKKKLEKLKRNGGLGFLNNANFSNLEALLGAKLGKSGFVIPGENNIDKFTWVVENFDYRFWRYDILKSKREADWVNKYVPVKYTETVKLLQDYLNVPSLDKKMLMVDKVGEYAGGEGMTTLEQQAQSGVDKINERHWWGWETTPGSAGKAVWSENKDGAGDFYSVKKDKHLAIEGWYGNGLAFSTQEAKVRYRNPMIFEKMEIENRFYNGLIDRKGLSKQMWEWHKKIYLGDTIKIGKLKIRPGYFPLFTPFFLFRGWWVDKMGLDWEAFKLVFSKTNEETWEKFKKLIKL